MRMILEAQVDNLEKQLAEESRELRREMDQIFAALSHAGTQMRSLTEHGNSSQVRQDSQSQSGHLDQTTTHTRSLSLCKFQHLTKKNIVAAYGRLAWYKITRGRFLQDCVR